MEFQILWFFLWGLLWAVYFMLDGFDFGVGILHNFLGRDEAEKRVMLHTIGPVWDGNEVWLITAGGATFAAFPTTYALMFSYLYTPLLLILFALIFRGVALEFREKIESPAWIKFWDVALFFGSLIPSLLFGVAFGNIFQGLPMDGNGYHGTLLTLLNPYGLLTGVLFVCLFIVHGALWLTWKTEGDLNVRAFSVANKVWYLLLLIAVVFLAATTKYTSLYDNYLQHKTLFAFPILAVAWLIGAKVYAARRQAFNAFVASSTAILLVFFTGLFGLYPNLIPSSLDPAYSLTLMNSSSSIYTLKIMTAVALLFVPVVIAYQVWIYWIFRHKVVKGQVMEGPESY
jgi:cytochrome d ubiquinol oxidase subunit II